MNTKTETTTTDDATLFARVQNAKGVTLSAGPAVVATGSKIAEKVVDQTTTSEPVEVKPAKLKADKPAKQPKVAAAPKAPKTPKLPKKTKVTAAPAVGPDGQPLEKVSRSIVPMKFKTKYAKNNGVCGDDVSLELKAATTTRNADKREVLDVEALWEIAKANQIDVAKYVDLNNGQKRMNVGNKLRGRLAAGSDVVIGTRTFKAEDFQPRH